MNFNDFMKKLKILNIKVSDIRVPTSDTLLGSDPFHKKPNWSCVYTQIELDNGIEGLSVCFTSGAGNDKSSKTFASICTSIFLAYALAHV